MITKENYEEFFLLYADNELPAETRLAVERFVDAHPDLREEWEALMQCRLEPEHDQQFSDKGSLLQYEEAFLSYVDGELDESGSRAVEALTLQHPSRDRELKQLMMTVSHPDMAVAFPDKEGLYRTGKRRRVVMMPWLQAGAAAAVLAAVVLLALPHKSGNLSGVAVKTQSASTTAKAPATAPALAPATAPAKNNPSVVTSAVPTTLHPIKDAAAVRQEETAGNNKRRTPMIPQTTGTTPAPAIVETTSVGDTSGRSSKQVAVAPAHPDKAALPVTLAVAVNIPREQSSFATQALLQEAQEDGTGDMADNLQQPAGKTKLRGLFRRVTRAFGKTAERDDDGQRQVLISAFQVALK